MPVIEALAREFEGRVAFVKVDTRVGGPTLEDFDVGSFPAYVVFLDGEEHDRLSLNFAPWYLEQRLRRMIERALEAQER